MYECFNCLQKSVVWQSYFDFVTPICVCSNCDAEIEYKCQSTLNTEE